MTLKWHSWLLAKITPYFTALLLHFDMIFCMTVNMEDSLIFCTVTRFIAKLRLKRVKVHVSRTTGYTSDSVYQQDSHVSYSSVAMETILAKQHQMSNVPICFLCY